MFGFEYILTYNFNDLQLLYFDEKNCYYYLIFLPAYFTCYVIFKRFRFLKMITTIYNIYEILQMTIFFVRQFDKVYEF